MLDHILGHKASQSIKMAEVKPWIFTVTWGHNKSRQQENHTTYNLNQAICSWNEVSPCRGGWPGTDYVQLRLVLSTCSSYHHLPSAGNRHVSVHLATQCNLGITNGSKNKSKRKYPKTGDNKDTTQQNLQNTLKIVLIRKFTGKTLLFTTEKDWAFGRTSMVAHLPRMCKA